MPSLQGIKAIKRTSKVCAKLKCVHCESSSQTTSVWAALSTLTLSVCQTLGWDLDEMTARWVEKVGQEWQDH